MAYERLIARAQQLQARSTATGTPQASTVTIAPRTGLDTFGEPLYGPGVSHDAVVDFTSRRVTTANGDEIMSKGEARIDATTPEIAPVDSLTLPDGETPRILEVEKVWVGGTLVTQKVVF